MNGASYTTGVTSIDASTMPTFNNDSVSLTDGNVVHFAKADADILKGGNMISNACWTVVLSRSDA